MKRKLIVLGMLCVLAANLLAVPAAGECELPEWKNGDTWDYSMTSSYLNVNITQVVDEVKTISVNGTDYEVYSVSSDMTMEIMGIELTTPSTNYYQKSDLAMVKTETSTSLLGMTTENVATFSPPKKDCNFPLDVGKTWSETCTAISYSKLNNEMEIYDEFETTFDYSVSEMETVTVPAGTFETYKIVCTDEFGDETISWYSPKVKNVVKQSTGDSSDPTTLELKSYDVAPPKGASVDKDDEFGISSLFEMPYLLFLIIIPIIVVVLVVALVARGKKKKRTQAQVLSKETVDFVIPSSTAPQVQTAPARAPQRTQAQRPPVRTRTTAPQQTAPHRQPQRKSPPRPPVKAQPKQVQQAPPVPRKPAAQPKPVQKQATRLQQPPPPPPPPPPPAVKNPCPTCKKELSLIQQYNRWYCHNCGKYW